MILPLHRGIASFLLPSVTSCCPPMPICATASFVSLFKKALKADCKVAEFFFHFHTVSVLCLTMHWEPKQFKEEVSEKHKYFKEFFLKEFYKKINYRIQEMKENFVTKIS